MGTPQPFKMYPETPPAVSMDFSRPRLKQLATWIRDDLDPAIAQDGPDRIRADDVLTLHEIFQALRKSTNITVLDLRATGIHKAVLEVAGIATRWPGRLADDCDKIISVWASKFGRLEDLRPFMYGRGGRLEGIAAAGDFTRAALLDRWQRNCPDRIASKRARRHGHIGFVPGAWWMTPLFAVHAGIIDLETAEGGICCDSHGAYAVVLKDTGETESSSEDTFTYRPQLADKGKFRLTAGNARSRHPLRVLRSHSLNSVWGPKAGIRYEGLHRTVGWVIRSAQADGHGYKAGDIIYEVKFERIDATPFAEVLKHPTASELDDYTEYKRLRRDHRDTSRTRQAVSPEANESFALRKDPSVIAPANTIASQLRTPVPIISPSPSRSATFKVPIASGASSLAKQKAPSPAPSGTSLALSKGSPIPRPSPPSGVSPAVSEYAHSSPEMPRLPTMFRTRRDSPPPQFIPRKPSPVGSKGSHRSDIKEVAPWIDYEPDVASASPSNIPRPGWPTDASEILSAQDPFPGLAEQGRTGSHGAHSAATSHHSLFKTGKDAKALKIKAPKSNLADLTKRGSRKTMKVPFPRSRNPLARALDGSHDGTEDEEQDYFTFKDCVPASYSSKPSPPMVGRVHNRASSSDLTPPFHARNSPTSPLIYRRRGAICLPPGSAHVLAMNLAHEAQRPEKTSTRPKRESPHHEVPRLPLRPPLPPVSLKSFISPANPAAAGNSSPRVSPLRGIISAARPAAPITSPGAPVLRSFISSVTPATPGISSPAVTSFLSSRPRSSVGASNSPSLDTGIKSNLRSFAKRTGINISEDQIVFKDPFKKLQLDESRLRSSAGVEPLAPEEKL
ncbi:hypothetical protein K491DRAFT_718507 [Lophiostoma macrostomum CBS 122681]|uniref:YDG domain-containing protein n=1 Tax=Lophiostoma macrostomum CBS 122681 TaxID=1314788 RepID=A0A6A6SYX9_9PLEO|nr:hypothetical protein K491DRAFT_718507 [Lophiostoma macrostomum CBS 122681]